MARIESTDARADSADFYFLSAVGSLGWSKTPVTMQVFNKKPGVIHGIADCLDLLSVEIERRREGTLIVNHDPDGSWTVPRQPALEIIGDYRFFGELETVMLGLLSRGTRLATRARECYDAADGVPVFYMGARHDHFATQAFDFAAIQTGGAGIRGSTFAQTGSLASGSMPHALIAALGGNTVDAATRLSTFARVSKNSPDATVSVLVDFDNDCVGTALTVCRALGKEKVHAVRLDTSESMIDPSEPNGEKGVTVGLTKVVREALDKHGFEGVGIVVSGGFDPDKIKRFQREDAPVDMYGVGTYILSGDTSTDFTADVVLPAAKKGRAFVDKKFAYQTRIAADGDSV